MQRSTHAASERSARLVRLFTVPSGTPSSFATSRSLSSGPVMRSDNTSRCRVPSFARQPSMQPFASASSASLSGPCPGAGASGSGASSACAGEGRANTARARTAASMWSATRWRTMPRSQVAALDWPRKPGAAFQARRNASWTSSAASASPRPLAKASRPTMALWRS